MNLPSDDVIQVFCIRGICIEHIQLLNTLVLKSRCFFFNVVFFFFFFFFFVLFFMHFSLSSVPSWEKLLAE